MAKAKFKIGDKVRVLDGRDIPDYTRCWTSFLENFVGTIHTIHDIDGVYNGGNDEYIGYKLDGCFKNSTSGAYYTFDERGLELVSSKEETPISKNFIEWAKRKEKECLNACEHSSALYWTTYKRRVTIVNMTTGKCGKSYCNKNDKFNRTIGLAIAWARYLGEEIPPMEEDYIVKESYKKDKHFNNKEESLKYFLSKCFDEKTICDSEDSLEFLTELVKDFNAEKRDFIYWSNGVTEFRVKKIK